jgi:transcriptional regulator with XRE-family HTH domain|tara:strand:- start:764 stop:1081 length:318 start_codon:yes stop_codon:yes gene_type:complete
MCTNVNIAKMNKRFKLWLESQNLNANSLSKLVDLNRSSISHIVNGRNKPSVDMLEKILSIYPNLNLNWLISGFGSMNINQNTSEKKEINKVVVFYKDSSYDELNN